MDTIEGHAMIESAVFLVPLLVGIAMIVVAGRVVAQRRNRRIRVLLVRGRRGQSLRIPAEVEINEAGEIRPF